MTNKIDTGDHVHHDPTGEDWIVTGMENIVSDNKITIYPNPVKQILNITSENTNIKTIRIFNIYGQEVMCVNQEFDNGINVEVLYNGIYMIEIETDIKFYTYKFIKQ